MTERRTTVEQNEKGASSSPAVGYAAENGYATANGNPAPSGVPATTHAAIGSRPVERDYPREGGAWSEYGQGYGYSTAIGFAPENGYAANGYAPATAAEVSYGYGAGYGYANGPSEFDAYPAGGTAWSQYGQGSGYSPAIGFAPQNGYAPANGYPAPNGETTVAAGPAGPVYERRAVYVGENAGPYGPNSGAPSQAYYGPMTQSAPEPTAGTLYEGRAAYIEGQGSSLYAAPAQLTGGQGGHNDKYGNENPTLVAPFTAQDVRAGR